MKIISRSRGTARTPVPCFAAAAAAAAALALFCFRTRGKKGWTEFRNQRLVFLFYAGPLGGFVSVFLFIVDILSIESE